MEKQGRQAATRGERSFKETDKSQVLRKTFLGSGIWKTKKKAEGRKSQNYTGPTGRSPRTF